MRTVFLAFVAASLAPIAWAANSFQVGCWPQGYSGSQRVNDPQDYPSCAAACVAQYNLLYAYEYSYYVWVEDHSELRYFCDCDASAPTNTEWQAGSCSLDSNVRVTLTQTTFSELGCYDYIFDYYDIAYTPQPDVGKCFVQCKDYNYAFVNHANFQDSSTILCNCSMTPDYYNPTTCSDTSIYAYQHTAGSSGPVPSTWVKRQERERLERSQSLQFNALCPAGLTACKVDGADDMSFECIDTDNELESCGGCLYGNYEQEAKELGVTATKEGTNCLSVAGIAPGGVTCSRGQCEAFACEEGFDLLNQTCIVDQ
ncbi:hypothetical protein I316_02814 [Kwoniella heveanensis BCC8398]|uniref:Protein CPL1-like domain-containing protein n=1 Tax=Kwoniella heveanensis BCC8398 TaxID=1296120 RepID=A0A1B9GW60_9TREE|nr:hypothetical protein I316_02814 [Kwoniella heveanensis BCC8398]